MKSSTRGPLDTPDRSLIAISAIVFFLYLYFAITYIWYTPFPGFAFTNTGEGWQVNDSSQAKIEVDDILVQIDDLTFEEFAEDKFRIPFSEFRPGDTVPNIVKEDGETIEIQMPEPGLNDRLRRLVATLWFFPFWLAGTAVLLFLRPRDLHWRLLIAFLYLTALWVVVGIIANWHVGASHIFAVVIGWILVPVVLHLAPRCTKSFRR